MENNCRNISAFSKKQIAKFRPTDSKSLRLRSAAFEMQLSHGVWGSPFKRHSTVCAKAVTSLLREGT